MLNLLNTHTVRPMVIWKNPKNSRRRSVNWRQVGEELRANPGRWGKVCRRLNRHDALTYVGKIHRGELNVGPGNFEARAEGMDVFARYLGDVEPSPAVDFSASTAAA